MHQDARYARNHEYPKGLNNVPCVVRSCIKMHATIWNNAPRSVQLVARNREYPKGLNNVPCVVWSCIKMHATRESVNRVPRLNHSCNKLHATHEKTRIKITALHFAPRGNHSCIKMHATDEIMNTRKRLNNVPCVVRSCIKMHATWNYARDVSFVLQNARDNMEKRLVAQM